MESVALERAVEVVRALEPEEQLQLRAMMDLWRMTPPAEAEQAQQRRLAERLLENGLLEHLPARYREGYTPEDDTDRHPPMVVKGRPVSETLLEDREPH